MAFVAFYVSLCYELEAHKTRAIRLELHCFFVFVFLVNVYILGTSFNFSHILTSVSLKFKAKDEQQQKMSTKLDSFIRFTNKSPPTTTKNNIKINDKIKKKTKNIAS